ERGGRSVRPARVQCIVPPHATYVLVGLRCPAVERIGKRRRHFRNLAHELRRGATRDDLTVRDEVRLIVVPRLETHFRPRPIRKLQLQADGMLEPKHSEIALRRNSDLRAEMPPPRAVTETERARD